MLQTTIQESSNVVLHLDVTPAVRTGLSDLVFSLAVLGGLADPCGRIWLTPKCAYVTIELTTTQEIVTKVNRSVVLGQLANWAFVLSIRVAHQ